jgi:hypothetical protein
MGALYLQEVKIMKVNKIKFMATVLLISIIYSILFANGIWAAEETTALERYFRLQGSTFIVAGVAFNDIGPSAKENSERLWPFDKKEARQKYRDIANEIMGTLFRPAEDISSAPLEVYLDVNLLNEKNSVAALIRVRILKHLSFVDKSESGEVKLLELVPIVFWERSYLYIDEDYVTDQKGSRYTFSEVIDKYVKEYLYGYIKKMLYYQNNRKDGPSSAREEGFKTGVFFSVEGMRKRCNLKKVFG